jgi:hypothetical protein
VNCCFWHDNTNDVAEFRRLTWLTQPVSATRPETEAKKFVCEASLYFFVSGNNERAFLQIFMFGWRWVVHFSNHFMGKKYGTADTTFYVNDEKLSVSNQRYISTSNFRLAVACRKWQCFL